MFKPGPPSAAVCSAIKSKQVHDRTSTTVLRMPLLYGGTIVPNVICRASAGKFRKAPGKQ
jgi:hypothetical protein